MNSTIFQLADIQRDGTILLSREKSLHLCNVLNKKRGDIILAGLVNGPIGPVNILDDSEGRIKIDMPTGPTPEPHSVDVILAMPRPKVMKRLWAPLASMGVDNILIIGAEQVEPFYFDSHALDEDVYLPRLIEGLEQARDTRLPTVSVTKSFRWFTEKKLAELSRDRVGLLAHPGVSTSIRTVVNRNSDHKKLTIAVGPEGGWTQNEMDTFVRHGFHLVGMRDRALRSDTAIISLLALVYDAVESR